VLDKLKQAVCEANLELLNQGLVIQTFGNASGIDAGREHVVIKPSGVPYEGMTPDQMVVVSLETGEVVEGELNPSSDTPTHLELYRAFDAIGGVVHTHSIYATAWAQARKEVPCLGTTHADYFHGPIPCTRVLTPDETEENYEATTGSVIVEHFAKIEALDFPGALVAGHGPFAWGKTPAGAVKTAVIMEYLARLASETLIVDAESVPLPKHLLDRHFLRKHGPDATYGQKDD